MTEQKLPQELDEQAMLFALGVLDPEDRQAFRVRLQGESDLLRQTAAAYQTTVDALASVVVPIVPTPVMRERLVQQLVLEATREAHAFELTANTAALGIAPLQPRDSVRERLLSRIERLAGASRAAESFSSVPRQIAVPRGGGQRDRATPAQEQGTPDSLHWQKTDGFSVFHVLQSCWQGVVNFMRTAALRVLTSNIVHPTVQGMTFIKATEGVWLNLAPGVTAKVLSFDSIARRTTSLVRFAPGTRYAPHRHAGAEELFVLEGGCRIAGRAMAVGDYHRADAGTEHHDTSSDDGCLLLIISSSQNEMLH